MHPPWMDDSLDHLKPVLQTVPSSKHCHRCIIIIPHQHYSSTLTHYICPNSEGLGWILGSRGCSTSSFISSSLKGVYWNWCKQTEACGSWWEISNRGLGYISLQSHVVCWG